MATPDGSPALLRTHVGRRPEHDALFRHQEAVRLRRRGPVVTRPRMHRLRQPEVEDLDGPLRRDPDVRGLQIPVHDPRLVRRLETFRDLPTDVDRLLDRKPPPLEPRCQVLAGHELHRDEAGVVDLVDAVHVREIRVVQRGQRLRLALEAPETLLVVRKLLGQHLDRHLALRAACPSRGRPRPCRRPRGTEDLVEREGLAGDEGHAPESLAIPVQALPHRGVQRP